MDLLIILDSVQRTSQLTLFPGLRGLFWYVNLNQFVEQFGTDGCKIFIHVDGRVRVYREED